MKKYTQGGNTAKDEKEVSRKDNYLLDSLVLDQKFPINFITNLSKVAKEYIGELNHYYDSILACMPGNVYWLDRSCILLGGNDNLAKMFGLKSRAELAGLTYEQMTSLASWTEGQGESFKQAELEVMATGKPRLNVEEPPVVIDGKTRYYMSNKVPLYNTKGEIIGVVGISLDITDKKEAEFLKIESAANKTKFQEQEKFTKTANQVAHDIRSPLASLLMIVKSCTSIPEAERIALREAATSIGDIADNLLNQYRAREDMELGLTAREQKQEPILLSATLLHLLTEKKFQYKERRVEFKYDFSLSGEFAFIRMDLTAFKRMISNLINNAVDAFERRSGKVVVKLDADAGSVRVVIADNGKGMPSEVIQKVMENRSVTQGKEEGHGIGLTQVREALSSGAGAMEIHSAVGKGTEVNLLFPRIKAPNWIAEEIRLTAEDIVVILDDDRSIHTAWDSRLEPFLRSSPEMTVKHFESSVDTLHFIQGLSEAERRQVFLLTDFELLEQDWDGLDVVEKTQVERSILVTSHYGHEYIRERAVALGTKVLPKQLASEVPIMIVETVSMGEGALRNVDLVLVDDDAEFARDIIRYVFSQDKVDYFEDPKEFMKAAARYPKETRIYLDNHFKAGVRGVKLAKELHELGYHRLYLISGDTFKPGELPDYIKVIRKDDIDNIKDW